MNLSQHSVWSLAKRLSYKTGLFSYSGRSLTKQYLGVGRDAIYPALGFLIDNGWFVPVAGRKGYRVLDHKEWAARHLDGCEMREDESETEDETESETQDETLDETLDENSLAEYPTRLAEYPPSSPKGTGGISDTTGGISDTTGGISDTTGGISRHIIEYKQNLKRSSAHDGAAAAIFIPVSKQNSTTKTRDRDRSDSYHIIPTGGISANPTYLIPVAENPTLPVGAPVNLAPLVAHVQEAVKWNQRIDDLDLSVVAKFPLGELTAAFDWSQSEPFWSSRVVGQIALRSFLKNFSTIQGQMKAKKRTAVSKGFTKAESVRPNADKPFQYAGEIY